MSEPRFDESLSYELCEFEKAMASLRPLPSRVDRDRLIFEAGRASALAVSPATFANKPWHMGGAPRRWLWPTATAAMTGVAAVLAALLFIQPTPPDVSPMATSEPTPASMAGTDHPPLRAASASERISPVLNEASYLVLRRRFTARDGSFASPEISGISGSSHEPWGNLLEMRQRFFGDPGSLGDVLSPDSGEDS